jgi:hypothetical protein
MTSHLSHPLAGRLLEHSSEMRFQVTKRYVADRCHCFRLEVGFSRYLLQRFGFKQLGTHIGYYLVYGAELPNLSKIF